MPTAAKLAAAVLFAAVGWAAGYFVTFTLPEGMRVTFLAPTIAAIGVWQGWFTCGARAGQGMSIALGTGLRTSVQIAFFGLLVFALREMFSRSARLRYDGPGEALIASLELFMEYGLQIMTAPILGTLFFGGLLAGALTEMAYRTWR